MDGKCEIPEAKCMDDRTIQAYRQILETSKKNPILGGMIPFSKNEIKIAENALNQYEKECSRCARGAKNDMNCLDVARTNFNRNMPSSMNDVYPWRNYDWDYANFISNNYSTKALPKAQSNNFNGIKQNVRNVVKSLDGFIFDAAPNNLSSSYGTDKNSDYPIFDCKDNTVCKTIEDIKRTKQAQPTKDVFMNKFPINGENSSSFYYKIGSCQRPDIKNMNDCEKKGYKWVPSSLDEGGGSCIQPRYMYIDNSPKPFFNGSNAKGMIPSITNDIVDIMPDKLLNTLLGQSTSSLQMDTCPNIEMFISDNKIVRDICVVLLFSLGIIYISKKCYK
jgi:hypothetical protein